MAVGSLQGTRCPSQWPEGLQLRILPGQTKTDLPPLLTTGSSEEPAGGVLCHAAVAARIFQESY